MILKFNFFWLAFSDCNCCFTWEEMYLEIMGVTPLLDNQWKIVNRQIANLSHCDFWTSRFASCDPTSLWITGLQVNDLWGYLINLSRSKYNILKNMSSFLNILHSEILHKVHVRNVRYLDVCTRYLLCSYDAFKQHCESWFKPRSCNTKVWKLELNFHIKANTGHCFCFQ